MFIKMYSSMYSRGVCTVEVYAKVATGKHMAFVERWSFWGGADIGGSTVKNFEIGKNIFHIHEKLKYVLIS